MKKILSSIVFIAWLLSAAAQENEILQHTTSWEAALQKAKQEKKLLFVDCYFTGCIPCAQMDKDVFPNTLVSSELQESFVAIKVDVFKEKLGDTINMKYGVSGFPTFLILDPSGKLLSMFVGFQDPSLLMRQLTEAKQKQKRNEFLSGFSTNIGTSYPVFYQKFYDRADRKIDVPAANAWIKEQKEWKSEAVAIAMLKINKLDPAIEEYLLNNYASYKAMYGDALVLGRTTNILTDQLNKMLNKEKNEEAFKNFLTTKAKQFPAADWKIMRFLLGNHYYCAVAKDTMALLQFISEEPVLYMNYMGALYSNLLVRKQLNPTTLALLCKWADKAVTADAPLEMMTTAASFYRQNKDMEGYKRFINMAIEKARRYNMPVERYEKMLTANQ
ncbi:thioredoxin family protein [Lacibacter luteus]|uniref:Thioredoxin family protein n=1 Tax=Lacibacter luteus TaxID=2508719 RepID=A0A4Q1CE15_9BACT|nr:thioredoxin family protein [Lacibacter luteus]RXK57860.1 thioredoxin family protein [Lacibacter luteus]